MTATVVVRYEGEGGGDIGGDSETRAWEMVIVAIRYEGDSGGEV